MAEKQDKARVVAWLLTDQRCRAVDDCEDFERVVLRDEISVIELERFQRAGRAERLILQSDHLTEVARLRALVDRLGEALLTAHDHLEMHTLKISHGNDYAQINAALTAYEASKGEA